MTPAQLRALQHAAKRERGDICPTISVHAAASDVDRAGLITWDGEPWHSAPRINDAGRAALTKENDQ